MIALDKFSRAAAEELALDKPEAGAQQGAEGVSAGASPTEEPARSRGRRKLPTAEEIKILPAEFTGLANDLFGDSQQKVSTQSPAPAASDAAAPDAAESGAPSDSASEKPEWWEISSEERAHIYDQYMEWKSQQPEACTEDPQCHEPSTDHPDNPDPRQEEPVRAQDVSAPPTPSDRPEPSLMEKTLEELRGLGKKSFGRYAFRGSAADLLVEGQSKLEVMKEDFSICIPSASVLAQASAAQPPYDDVLQGQPLPPELMQTDEFKAAALLARLNKRKLVVKTRQQVAPHVIRDLSSGATLSKFYLDIIDPEAGERTYIDYKQAIDILFSYDGPDVDLPLRVLSEYSKCGDSQQLAEMSLYLSQKMLLLRQARSLNVLLPVLCNPRRSDQITHPDIQAALSAFEHLNDEVLVLHRACQKKKQGKGADNA